MRRRRRRKPITGPRKHTSITPRVVGGWYVAQTRSAVPSITKRVPSAYSISNPFSSPYCVKTTEGSATPVGSSLRFSTLAGKDIPLDPVGSGLSEMQIKFFRLRRSKLQRFDTARRVNFKSVSAIIISHEAGGLQEKARDSWLAGETSPVSGVGAIALPQQASRLRHFRDISINMQLGRLIRLLCRSYGRRLHSGPSTSTLLNPRLVFNPFKPTRETQWIRIFPHKQTLGIL